jgi:predicted glutamine amidotransferase
MLTPRHERCNSRQALNDPVTPIIQRKRGVEMCRLYGFMANEETKVECTLVHAQNALLMQSESGYRGRAHADGWGMAFYHDELPELERRAKPAFKDLHFSNTAERVYAEAVIAHVRLATVGTPNELNCHPFVFGKWAFAHNGTVSAFTQLKHELENETIPVLQARRLGETDSEQFFYWLLSRLRAAGIALSDSPSADDVAEVVACSVRELASRCREAGATEAKLNIVLTNGHIMVATRWNNDLFMVLRKGIHDCEICGIPHVHHDGNHEYRAIVLASEKISDEPWTEVPNYSVIAVDKGIIVNIQEVTARVADRCHAQS